ncbi:MAG: MoaD/ThiS family protein [Bacillota bacterium]
MVKVKVKAVASICDLVAGGADQEIRMPAGSTLADLLQKLIADSGEKFRRRIFLEDSQESDVVRKDIRLLINGRDYIFVEGLDSLLEDGDRVSIMPLMGGG